MDTQAVELQDKFAPMHQDFIEAQNHCGLCNDELEITVTSYLDNNMLQEKAYCPKCDIKVRVKDHKMQ